MVRCTRQNRAAQTNFGVPFLGHTGVSRPVPIWHVKTCTKDRGYWFFCEHVLLQIWRFADGTFEAFMRRSNQVPGVTNFCTCALHHYPHTLKKVIWHTRAS
jgi:hypothetical protein